jgi:hypothetical protein
MLLQLVGPRLSFALLCQLEPLSTAALLLVLIFCCVCRVLLQLVGPRLSLALEATSALRCLLRQCRALPSAALLCLLIWDRVYRVCCCSWLVRG